MANIQKKNIDLLHAYRQRDVKRKTPEWVKLMLFPLVLILVFASVFVYQTMESNKYQNKIDAVQAEYNTLNKKMTDEKVSEALAMWNKLIVTSDNLTSVIANLATYPRIDRAAFEQIVNACNYTVLLKGIVFDDATGALVVTANTKDVTQTAAFVERLNATGAFSYVTYDGYQEVSESEDTTVEDMVNDMVSDDKTKDELNATTGEAIKEEQKKTTSSYQMVVYCYLKAGDQ